MQAAAGHGPLLDHPCPWCAGSGRPSAAGQDFAARLADADAAAHPLVRLGSLEHAARANSSEQPSLERGTSLDRPRPPAPSFSAWSPAERKGDSMALLVRSHVHL